MLPKLVREVCLHCSAGLGLLFATAGNNSLNMAATTAKAAAPTTLSSWVSMMPGAQALADSMEQDEPVIPGGLNLIVMGPPLAGKSTQAQMLSDRYQLVAITIDDLLMVSSQPTCPVCLLAAFIHVSDSCRPVTTEHNGFACADNPKYAQWCVHCMSSVNDAV